MSEYSAFALNIVARAVPESRNWTPRICSRRIRQLGREAATGGLDPNVWFGRGTGRVRTDRSWNREKTRPGSHEAKTAVKW